MKQIILIITIILLLPTIALAQGVAPARVELSEDEEYFEFKITNRQQINMDVELKIEGDDFLELEENKITLTENQTEKILTAKIKKQKYNETQNARIIALRTQETDSQIAVVSGNAISVSLLVYEENAKLNAKISAPIPNKNGTGPYIIQIKNEGLNDVENAQSTLEINNIEKIRTFNIKGREEIEITKKLGESLPKGAYDAKLTINYDDKTKQITNTFQIGTPKIEIKDIEVDNLDGELITLNILVKNDWPEEISDLSIIAQMRGRECETQKFKTTPESVVEVPLIFRVDEQFKTRLNIGEYYTNEYDFEIRDGTVYVDGEIKYESQKDKETNIYLTLIIISLMILLILTIITYKKYKKISKKLNKK